MNSQYKELLALVARNGAINGERALEIVAKSEEKSEANEKTQEMIDNFRRIEDALNNDQELSVLDYIYLWVGASVSRTLIQKNIDTWTAVIQEYDTNIIPKLYEIAKSSDPEEQTKLINEYFNSETESNEN